MDPVQRCSLGPGQGDVGRNSTAPVEDALRSVPHEFDTRPVSILKISIQAVHRGGISFPPTDR
jgi:hypothetical protein